MSYERPRIIGVRGRTITIAHLQLPSEVSTFLTADLAASGTALTVLDNAGFAQDQLILLGHVGVEQTEIKKVNAAVTDGTSLTSTAVTFGHTTGAPVRRVLFDQWRIYGNSTNSSTGATLVATIDMQMDALVTTYVNTGTEYNFYLVLPIDSLNSVVGDTYSDGVSNSTAYAENTVGSIIRKALRAAKAERGGDIDDQFLFDEINDGLQDFATRLKRWSFLQNFNYVLGQAQRGTISYTLPTDIGDTNSIKSILDVRVGPARGLTYLDKKAWEKETEDLIYTTTTSQATSGATSLNITNSYDFDDSGTVHVYVSGTQYALTYTGVTRSATAGVLTGIPASGTGSISTTIASGTNVFQDEREGVPKYFTVFDGSLYIYPMADATEDNTNVYLDYYTSKTAVDSAGDVIEPPRYDAIKHWLTWKIRSLNNAAGQLDMKDGDKLMYEDMLINTIRREVSGQKYKMIPKINSISYNGSSRNPQVLPVTN